MLLDLSLRREIDSNSRMLCNRKSACYIEEIGRQWIQLRLHSLLVTVLAYGKAGIFVCNCNILTIEIVCHRIRVSAILNLFKLILRLIIILNLICVILCSRNRILSGKLLMIRNSISRKRI